jgi:hypothetical protein
MAIELTAASQELLRDIRVTLGSVGLSGDELVRGLKTFNSVFSASDGILAANNTTVENLSVLGNFIFKQTTFETISALDARIAKDLTANELRIPGSSVFNDVNVTNDTLVQNLTVNGNFVSDAAKFYTPPTEAFILYDSVVPEIFILTPSSINYTPKIITTRGRIDFSDSLLQNNRTFEGNIQLSKTDSSFLIVDGIDVLRGSITIANQSNLETITLTAFKQVNNMTLDLPKVMSVKFPLLEAVLQGMSISPRTPTGLGPLSSIECPVLKYVGLSLAIGGYVSFFGTDNIFGNPLANFRNINFNSLEFVPNLLVRNTRSLSAIDFPLLETVFTGIYLQNNIDVRRISFPILQQTSSIFLESMPVLQEVNLPQLQLRIGGYLNLSSGLNSLTGLYLPNLEFSEPPYQFNTTFVGGASALRKINLGFDKLKTYGGGFEARGCSLDTATVTSLLSTFVRLDGTNNTRLYSNNILLSSSRNEPPTFAGGSIKVAPATSFTKTNNTITVNMVDHGYSDLDIVTFDLISTDNFVLSGFGGTYQIRVTSLNQFTYSHRISQTYTYTTDQPGEVLMYSTTNANDGFRSFQQLVLRTNSLSDGRFIDVARPRRD